MGGEFDKFEYNSGTKEDINDIQTMKKVHYKNSSTTNASSTKGKSKSQSKTGGCRENHKKKKEKLEIVAKDKKSHQESKVIEIIQKNNTGKKDFDLIYKIIDKHFFMQTLNEQARNEIIITMSLGKVKEGTTLFTQGSRGNYWYIVHSGELSCFIDGKYVKKFERGDSFGEIALMNDSPRSATVVAKTETTLWVLKRQVFRKILNYLFDIYYEENMKFLESINLPLDNNIKSFIANNLIQEIYKKDEYICKEGELGSCMFIIKEGEVECIKGDRIVRTLQKGDNFGQKALLEGDKRTLSVKAKTDCKIYSISAELLKNQFGENYKEALYLALINIAFQNSSAFNSINPKMIAKTFSLFKFNSFQNNEVIFEKGADLNNKLIVVLEGNIVDKNKNKVEGKRSEILFDKKLLEGKMGKADNNLVADPDCVIAEADYSEFKNLLGGDIKAAQKKSVQINSIENILFFKILSEDKIEFILNNLKEEKFDNGKKIITQGEKGDKLYIIKSGRVDFFINSKYIRSFSDGDDFGSRALIHSEEKRSATAIANGTVYCFTLTAAVFKSILEPNLMEYFDNQLLLQDESIELKDLESIKELGSGSFGFVNLVKNKKNKQLYAIKALNVIQIKRENLETCVELEKNVLLKITHPFIMKMVKYLKNENFIFFITEYIKGKELWEVIRDIGLLNKEQTQFYGASILLAINYLHKNKIIYRDIKPENIMVNTKGYVKLIDFGTVKEIKERTTTIIGTSHYMAPEILKGEGYSFQVDVWSIAVCMYEFFCGRLPFGEEYEDPMEIYKAVATDELVFPKFVKDGLFIELMHKMLNKNPANRLWKFQQVKDDPYFKDFDWNKLISLSLKPPYMIKFKQSIDGSSIPYLNYLKTKNIKPAKKKKGSTRQLKFEKWLKNF